MFSAKLVLRIQIFRNVTLSGRANVCRRFGAGPLKMKAMRSFETSIMNKKHKKPEGLMPKRMLKCNYLQKQFCPIAGFRHGITEMCSFFGILHSVKW